ncbi:MAG: hypothetical protein ACKE5M_04190 [Methylophilaceae bacterium]
MAKVLENENSVEFLDQMLEDLAGEEFDEFDDDLNELDSDLGQFSATEDEFVEIDTYH